MLPHICLVLLVWFSDRSCDIWMPLPHSEAQCCYGLHNQKDGESWNQGLPFCQRERSRGIRCQDALCPAEVLFRLDLCCIYHDVPASSLCGMYSVSVLLSYVLHILIICISQISVSFNCLHSSLDLFVAGVAQCLIPVTVHIILWFCASSG